MLPTLNKKILTYFRCRKYEAGS